ncbi:hypothetical protein [Gordonia neofelifaecis]|nr:hypothetical protein [Gordonia neofelifaecis]
MNRSAVALGSVVAAAATVAAVAGPASAVPAPGSPEGAVTFSARDLGGCRAEFSIVNKTNVTTYTIDWRVDEEDGRTIAGIDFPVYRTGGMSSKANSPTWPDEVPANTVDNRTMVSDRDPVTATYIQDLKNPTGEFKPALPNPDAATHRVDYRIVLGPPGNNGQTPNEQPEWLGDRQWRTITVTGCAAAPDPGTGSVGGGSSSGSLGDLLGGLFG